MLEQHAPFREGVHTLHNTLCSIGRQSYEQSKLLDRAAEVTSPGGRLVYSVCTVLREENEEVVDLFLERNPAFRRDPSRPTIAHVEELLDAAGDMRCYPHRHETDGFYAARLLRTD